MNQLSFEKQVRIVALLSEGISIHSIHRLTGVHRDTVGRLSLRLGEACHRLHDSLFQKLYIPFIQMDEQHSFVKIKSKNLTPEHTDPEVGDTWLWLAFDPASKVVASYHVGNRTDEDALTLVRDVHSRLLNRPQISTDGFEVYGNAIRSVYGTQDIDYAMIVKEDNYKKVAVFGNPDMEQVSTSLLERTNLTTRMGLRRHARRTNAHSKRLANHRAAIALHFGNYHFCRVHETLQVTPAMEIGIADHVWPVGELIQRALAAPAQEPPPRPPRPKRPRLYVVSRRRDGKIQ